ncbi:hypothetical protein L596_025374 [Steinernema carpocapsae]|uniref:Uncharacterized protein n=1 Tax=Steinernema carpocapsae TaxID=34508 RepID=A0A4U5M7K7_STECR|nr:hypothetical protein L596_025374 [Steinernema carpocapsae]
MWFQNFLAIFAFAALLAAKDVPTTGPPCYWTDCIPPWQQDTCKDGFKVKNWEQCFWPWKKEYCCPE